MKLETPQKHLRLKDKLLLLYSLFHSIQQPFCYLQLSMRLHLSHLANANNRNFSNKFDRDV